MTTTDTNNNFLDDSLEYEAWLLNIEASITYKNKSLIQWLEELAMPYIDTTSELTPAEIDIVHNKYINLTEVVYTNLALVRSADKIATAIFDTELTKKKQEIEEQRSEAGLKRFTAESLNNAAMNQCERSYKNKILNECLLCFWETQSYKLKNLNDRLTSLHMAKRSSY